MPAPPPNEKAFNEALCARLREVREAKGLRQRDMALLLGVSEEAYRKYERRSPLPMFLVPTLAALAGESVEWVVTGRDGRSRRILQFRR